MDIKTIIANLDNTIAGKKMLLATYENPSMKAYPEAVRKTMASVLAINIAELERIRADLQLVDQ